LCHRYHDLDSLNLVAIVIAAASVVVFVVVVVLKAKSRRLPCSIHLETISEKPQRIDYNWTMT
jgi:hypothetical protein